MAKPSPFSAVYQQLGADFAEYDGWTLPSTFGDADSEKHALKQSCTAFDLSSFARITLKGQDSDEIIRQLTDSCRIPEDGSWMWAKTSNPDNSQSIILRIGVINGTYTIITQPDARQAVQQIIGSIAEQKALDSFKITDITEKTAMLALYGPTAFDSITAILPFDMSDLAPGRMKSFSFFMMSVTVLRGSWLKGEGLEIICPTSAAPMAGTAIVKYHKKQNITPGGMDCLLEAMKEIDF